jgi:hypothetical protein
MLVSLEDRFAVTIEKDPRGQREIDPMLAAIGFRFVRIPFKPDTLCHAMQAPEPE